MSGPMNDGRCDVNCWSYEWCPDVSLPFLLYPPGHPCRFRPSLCLHLPMNCILYLQTTLHKSPFSTHTAHNLSTLYPCCSLFCFGLFLKPVWRLFPHCTGLCVFLPHHIHSVPWLVPTWFFISLVWILQGVRISEWLLSSLWEFIPEKSWND